MLNTLLSKISAFKYLHLRNLCILAMMLLLSGCDEGAAGEDTNYEVQASCWQTKIIAAVLKIINKLYERSSAYVTSNAMSTGGAAVICIAFSIWLAFKILKILPSFKEENLGEVWTEIGQKLFVCAFCMYIVYNPENITWAMKTFVIPVYNSILELGVRVLKGSNVVDGQSLGEYGAVSYKYNYSMCEVKDMASGGNLDLQGAVTPMANCLVCAISDRLNSGIKIGIKLICTFRLSAALVGCIVLFIFTAAKFFFVLFIIDSLFRLNFAVFLMPLMIIGIPFNFTRKWSKHCFLMFLNSSGVMLFLGLLVVISVSALENIIGTIGGSFSETYIEGRGPMLMSILFISFILVNIPGMGVALADKFIGGGGGDEFQKKITKFVMQTAKKLGAAVLGSVTSNVSKAITNTMEKYESTREILDTAKNIQSKLSDKANSLAGYNDD